VQVAIVILNWNGARLLPEFLPSVVENSPNARIIVADNASTDNSLAILADQFLQVEVLPMPQNKGFAGGYNQALGQIDADVYVLLNSDVMVTPNWLQAPLEALQQAQCAAVQPKIRAYRNQSHFEHAGACGGFIDRLGYPFCRGRIFATAEKDQGQYDQPASIFWASGACMFIKRDVFRAAGGFSEAFFAHMEEIDLCWRIQRMGFQIQCVPQSTVYHLGGATLDYLSPRKAFLNFRNSLYMIVRNYPDMLFFPLLERLFWDGIAGMRFLMEGKPRFTWIVVKSHFAFYSRLGTLLSERRQIRKLGNASPAGRYRGLILVDHFIRKKHRFSELDKSRFS
jgi:hypothetical protein